MVPHISSYLLGESLLKRILLEDFREHHNSDYSLPIISQQKIRCRLFFRAAHACWPRMLSASEPHLTLTHYQIGSQSLIVLVICNLPLPAKYSKHRETGHQLASLLCPEIFLRPLPTQTPEFFCHHEFIPVSSDGPPPPLQPTAESNPIQRLGSSSLWALSKYLFNSIQSQSGDNRQQGLPDFLNASEIHSLGSGRQGVISLQKNQFSQMYCIKPQYRYCVLLKLYKKFTKSVIAA